METEMDLYEHGHADALARVASRHDDPEYKLGYLDGLAERAQMTAVTEFRDRTIGGLLFEAKVDGEDVAWSVTDPDGQRTAGLAIDMEQAVAACEGVARSLGQPVARLSVIMRSIAEMHPELADTDRRRLAAKTVEYISTRGRLSA